MGVITTGLDKAGSVNMTSSVEESDYLHVDDRLKLDRQDLDGKGLRVLGLTHLSLKKTINLRNPIPGGKT